MMMITEFLTARLDEDEATAHHAGPARVAWLTYHNDSGQMLYTTVAAADECEPWVADGHELPPPASVRVVFDPAGVLADVAAKRKIVIEYATVLRMPDAVYTGTERATGFRLALEMVCRAFASAYAGHPDFDQSWRT